MDLNRCDKKKELKEMEQTREGDAKQTNGLTFLSAGDSKSGVRMKRSRTTEEESKGWR